MGTQGDIVKVLDQAQGENWALYQADTVEAIRGIPDESVGYSIFSPPFASLYTYSASERDMGNARTHAEFHEHLSFLLGELLRITKPGRLLSMHCMLLPTTKARDGEIGLIDFRGELIRASVEAGWIFHSEVTIWKDPVTAMQRTKALGLLHKQLKKDSCMSRQGIPDYLCTFRRPGENLERVTHPDTITEMRSASGADDSYLIVSPIFPVERWQRWASPIWSVTEERDWNGFQPWATASGVDDEGFAVYCSPNESNQDKRGILAGDTLQRESAREERDERHVCPLQKEVIRRGVLLWSNPGDVVFDPFAGIGSAGFVACREGRKFIGIELKRSYYEQAVKNLRGALKQTSLLDLIQPTDSVG
jgi:hypothetical protein